MLNIGLHVGAFPSLVTSQCSAECRGAGGYTGSSCIRRWRTLAVYSRVYAVYPQSLTQPRPEMAAPSQRDPHQHGSGWRWVISQSNHQSILVVTIMFLEIFWLIKCFGWNDWDLLLKCHRPCVTTPGHGPPPPPAPQAPAPPALNNHSIAVQINGNDHYFVDSII